MHLCICVRMVCMWRHTLSNLPCAYSRALSISWPIMCQLHLLPRHCSRYRDEAISFTRKDTSLISLHRKSWHAASPSWMLIFEQCVPHPARRPPTVPQWQLEWSESPRVLATMTPKMSAMNRRMLEDQSSGVLPPLVPTRQRRA